MLGFIKKYKARRETMIEEKSSNVNALDSDIKKTLHAPEQNTMESLDLLAHNVLLILGMKDSPPPTLFNLLNSLKSDTSKEKTHLQLKNILIDFMKVLSNILKGEESTESLNNFFDQFVFNLLKNKYLSIFYGDRLLTLDKSASFLNDPTFVHAFDKRSDIEYDGLDQQQSVAWRLHVLIWAAQYALNLEGDFVECGVYLGDFSHIICNYLNFENINKKFYLFDSFEGLDVRSTSREDYHKSASGTYDFLQKIYKESSDYERVLKKFQSYHNVIITKGFLPDSFQKCKPEKISFLHIDLNAPAAELSCIEELYDHLIPGAIVIYDDYGWKVFEKQKEVADQFARKKGYTILELPTGQGVFIKSRN